MSHFGPRIWNRNEYLLRNTPPRQRLDQFCNALTGRLDQKHARGVVHDFELGDGANLLKVVRGFLPGAFEPENEAFHSLG